MDSFNHFKEKALNIQKSNFDDFALSLFRFQAENNTVYRQYIEHLDIQIGTIETITEIPFLPIQFFKSHDIKTGVWVEEKTFRSSGTTGTRSKHFIEDLHFYHRSSLITAESHFDKLSEYEIFGLLPSYLEQGESSLVEMINHFHNYSRPGSGFYMNNTEDLIKKLNKSSNPSLIFGVSYALLDLATKIESLDWSQHTFVETGGMKGRKKEITKTEIHTRLKSAFNTRNVHSEYGMTELMSQAYGKEGLMRFAKWCTPLVRDLNDPFHIRRHGSGGLNIIDLANIHSCAFVETEDIGKISANGTFEVLGRLDNSDIRGCSLLL